MVCQDDETQQSSARTQDPVAERPSASKEANSPANPTPNLASHHPTLSKTALSKSSMSVSPSKASGVNPIDGSRSASTTLSTRVEKMITEPVEDALSKTAPDHQTVSDRTDSLLPPTAQAPLRPDSVTRPPGFTSTGPSRWRPGDKARLVISKKLRDVDPPPPPDVNDPKTWAPFLPSDEEFDADEVRSQWDELPSRRNTVKGTATTDGIRMHTRQALAQKSKASEGVQLRNRSERRATNPKLSGGPKAS
ncbi:hypothetical protein FRC01_007668 [Tulasnella sp. 417]|nr:hypothetical protein FRC01_007668 [Tulasnella sp. 417]